VPDAQDLVERNGFAHVGGELVGGDGLEGTGLGDLEVALARAAVEARALGDLESSLVRRRPT
jgi:hypothetical protein